MNKAENPSLGPCCGCGCEKGVRNVMCLPERAPEPIGGWGCITCGLPSEGAIAVLCDECLASGAPIHYVCAGYPSEGRRLARDVYRGAPFGHNAARHSERALSRRVW